MGLFFLKRLIKVSVVFAVYKQNGLHLVVFTMISNCWSKMEDSGVRPTLRCSDRWHIISKAWVFAKADERYTATLLQIPPSNTCCFYLLAAVALLLRQ